MLIWELTHSEEFILALLVFLIDRVVLLLAAWLVNACFEIRWVLMRTGDEAINSRIRED